MLLAKARRTPLPKCVRQGLSKGAQASSIFCDISDLHEVDLRLSVDEGASHWRGGVFVAFYPIVVIFVFWRKLGDRVDVCTKYLVVHSIFLFQYGISDMRTGIHIPTV
jgi:hypothetical protein